METRTMTDGLLFYFCCCMALLAVWKLWGKCWYESAANWVSRKKTNRSRGSSLPAAIWFTVIVCATTTFLAWRQSRVYTENSVAIIAIHTPYRFTFQHVDETLRPIGDPFTEDICHDYAAPGDDFRQGLILKKLIHTEEGGCWSLNPDKHCGFYKLRDPEAKPIFLKEYARNQYD